MPRRATGVLPVLAFLVTAGSFVARAGTSLPDPGERWIEVRTAHFTLFSNASDTRTREMGISLERFRAALARVVSGLEVNSPVPTWVFVFKNEASFRPYKKRVGPGPANVTGAFAGHRDGNYVAIDASPPTDPWSVVYHEYLHYFLNNNFEDIPLWFNEGMAECYSTFAADAGHVEIGRPIEEHLRLLRSGTWIPLHDLFAIDPDSKDYNEGRRQGLFYAESWALVHYLAWGRTEGKARGVEFLAQFPPRAGLREALKPLLGPDWGALETKLVEYVKRNTFTYSILDLKDLTIDPPSDPVVLTRPQTLSRLGDYLVHSQTGREEDAEAHFQAAIRADASLASAWTGLGYLRDLQGRRQEATKAYEKALTLSPADPLTMFLYAESLMDWYIPPGTITRRSIGDGPPPELARARELYRASIRLRPAVAEAYAGLGGTFTLDDANLPEGIEALEKARRMLPARMDVALNLAGLYARNGERSKAQDLVERVLLRSGDRRTYETGQEILLQSDLKVAERLVNTGDVDAGVAIIKDVQARTQDASLKRQLGEHLASIEETRTLNRQIETYNRAIDLANRKDYRKSAATLEKLAGEVKDPKLQKEIETLLKRVRQAIAAGTKR
jgi:tetratricopeptide (TPR) repeat protein